MEKPNYYGILPADVRYDKNLKWTEKVLYSELTALTNAKGYCYATNSYFAELYEVHKKTIGHWISHLAELGYIKVELILKKGSCEVEERRIYITRNQKAPTLSTKEGGGCLSDDTHPINQKMEENNINIILQDEYYKRKKEEEIPELFSIDELFY